jgi:hypothetical protein
MNLHEINQSIDRVDLIENRMMKQRLPERSDPFSELQEVDPGKELSSLQEKP